MSSSDRKDDTPKPEEKPSAPERVREPSKLTPEQQALKKELHEFVERLEIELALVKSTRSFDPSSLKRLATKNIKE
jgi:hypothetical protein